MDTTEPSCIFVELVLGRQQDRLVVEQQEQEVEQEQHDDACHHHKHGRDAVLLGHNSRFSVQWLQKVRQASADAIALWQRVALAVGRGPLGIAHWVDAVLSRHVRFVSYLCSRRHGHLASLRGWAIHKSAAAQRPQAHAAEGKDQHATSHDLRHNKDSGYWAMSNKNLRKRPGEKLWRHVRPDEPHEQTHLA